MGDTMEKTRGKQGLLRADALSIGFLLLFIAIAYLMDSIIKPDFGTTGLIITGLVMSLIPAVIWLGFFHRKDSAEPEPLDLVLKVALLGAILAFAIGTPLTGRFFKTGTWLHSSGIGIQLLGGFLVIGLVQETLKYAAVRYTVFKSEEFDGTADGIIYATAAGIGYATAVNISFVIQSGGVDMGLGAIRIVLEVLAQAGFSGIVGYFIGRQRFGNMPLWWMPSGLLIAAAMNAAFITLRVNLIRGSLGNTRLWLGLLVTIIFTGIVSWILTVLIRRDNLRFIAGEVEV